MNSNTYFKRLERVHKALKQSLIDIGHLILEINDEIESLKQKKYLNEKQRNKLEWLELEFSGLKDCKSDIEQGYYFICNRTEE